MRSATTPFDRQSAAAELEPKTRAPVRAAIAGLRRALNDGGLAYVEVPDARHSVDRLVAPYHDFNTEHINHFSLRLLDTLMATEGFNAVSTGEKTIMASPRHPYPAAFGLWRKGCELVHNAPIKRDDDLIAAIIRSVEASGALMRRIDAALRDALVGHKRVIVWGTGHLAFKLLRDTVLSEKCVTFVDGSPQKQGLHIGGRPVLGPDGLARDASPIVITSMHAADAIADAITQRFGTARRIIRLPEGAGNSEPR